MSYGPIELLVVSFPGNRFKGELAPALTELVDNETIRVIDLVFATKHQDGTVATVEIQDLDDETYQAIDPLIAEIRGLLSQDDVQRLATRLDTNSSAGIMLFENTWARRFADAVANANGEVLLNERIPRSVIEELIATQAAQAA